MNNHFISSTVNSFSTGVLSNRDYDIEPAGIGITVLSDPVKDDGSIVDIIFVHGLNTRPTTCWRKGDLLWPRDLLVKNAPSARVATFGYGSYNIDDASKSRVRDHARNLLEDLFELRSNSHTEHRPLIFVGYSIGGLVIKQALVDASKQQQFRNMRSCTTGICFIATPHAGNRVNTMGEMVSNIAKVAFKKPDMAMVEDLKNDSDGFDALLKEFRDQSDDINILIVYELRKTILKKGLLKSSIMVVPEIASKFILANEVLISSDSDHLDICKFDGEGDRKYQRLLAGLRQLVLTADETLKSKNIDSLLWSVENLALGVAPRPPKALSRRSFLRT